MSVSTTRSETDDSTATLSPSSEPIAIPSSFNPSDSSFRTSFDSSASYTSHAVDEPLRDLLPAFSTNTVSSGSSSDGSAYSRGLGKPSLAEGYSAFARKVVSAPVPYSTSPRSPLANASSPDPSSSSPRRRSAQFPPPSSPTAPPFAPSPSSLHPSPTTRRRRSSVSLSSSTGSAPPHGAFVGSFEESLLKGRLSSLPSLPLPFVASIGVLGAPDSPTRLRCPPHLIVPFEAFYYTSDGAASSAPYVGTVELDTHYISLLRPSQSTSSADTAPTSSTSSPPRYPGYRVPVRGQVQLVLKNANSTALKLFLVPYDLTGLSRDGKGGRTFLRQRSYAVEVGASDETKGRLRYAVILQFCSPPMSTSKGGKTKEPHYYLHANIRVVFASRGLDSGEKLRVVAEKPAGGGSGTGFAAESFTPYGGPALEWEIARKKLKEREKLVALTRGAERERGQGSAMEGEEQDGEAIPTPQLPPPHVHDPDGTTYDVSRSTSPLVSASPTFTRPDGLPRASEPDEAAPPSSFDLSNLSSTLSNATPLLRKLPRSSLSLSFERPASPIPSPLLTPTLSALSSSRPPSRTGSDGSGSGSGKGSSGSESGRSRRSDLGGR